MKQLTWKQGSMMIAGWTAAAILFGSVIGYQTYADYEKEDAYYKVYNALYIHFNGIPSVEYGNDFDAASLVLDASGGLRIEDEVNEMVPGQYAVRYIVSDYEESFEQNVEKAYERIIVVKDTKKPEITFDSDAVTVKVNKDFDPKEHILSVKDPVDGELKLSTSLESGTYVIRNDTDLTTPGSYAVTVEAMDRNGNVSSAVLPVTVEAYNHAGAHYTANYDAIYAYLTERMGLSYAGACGIIANMWAESGFRPTAAAVYKGKDYYGLCQWGEGRLSNLYAFCKKNGYSSASIEGQCAFLQHELEDIYPSTLQKIRNVEDSEDGAYEAARVFFYEFERGAAFANRGRLARCYYGY